LENAAFTQPEHRASPEKASPRHRNVSPPPSYHPSSTDVHTSCCCKRSHPACNPKLTPLVMPPSTSSPTVSPSARKSAWASS
jgi:hypothetical protein